MPIRKPPNDIDAEQPLIPDGRYRRLEVDAGVVYVTDVRAAGEKVKGIRIPTAVNASTTYPIATLTTAPNKAGGKAFTDYVLSADGAAVLTAAGFAKP